MPSEQPDYIQIQDLYLGYRKAKSATFSDRPRPRYAKLHHLRGNTSGTCLPADLTLCECLNQTRGVARIQTPILGKNAG